MSPIVREHAGRLVVRDDLFPGGTKARFIGALFVDGQEVVYASPPEGGAQTALAHIARTLGKRATIFVAKRRAPHPRSLMAKALGAKVLQVAPGYLSVVQARARAYCAATGARLAPFGMDFPGAVEAIAQAARATGLQPAEVWCAAGSGVLARGLAQAWPQSARHCVQIGRAISAADCAGAAIHIYPLAFSRPARGAPPFPADPHYDAKAWEFCLGGGRPGALFWNVTGPAGAVTT